jgi:hypothetical protein
MAKVEKDPIREKRIDYEIVVDAYSREERAMGWYYYLADNLIFPFFANWQKKNWKTAETEVKKIKVLCMADEEECMSEMSVLAAYTDDPDETDVFSVSLAKIQAIDVDQLTQDALGDWAYWLARGYEF